MSEFLKLFCNEETTFFKHLGEFIHFQLDEGKQCAKVGVKGERELIKKGGT
jgi:hypothetical protein